MTSWTDLRIEELRRVLAHLTEEAKRHSAICELEPGLGAAITRAERKLANEAEHEAKTRGERKEAK